MVLGKLLIKKKPLRESLGVGPTFESFNDSGELSHNHSLSPSPRKPSMVLGRAKTVGARLEDMAEQPGNLRSEQSSSGRGRQRLLRAPSFDKVCSSEDAFDDEMSADEQGSGSECCDDEDSSWSSYGDQIPQQFHISCADTVNAPAQFVVPILMDNKETSDNQNECSQSESSLLHFTPYLQDEYHSVHPDDTQLEDVIAEIATNVSDVSPTSQSHETEDFKPRQKQRRPTTKRPGSRLKRKEIRSLKCQRDPGFNDEADGILPTNDQLLMIQAPVSHGSNMRQAGSKCSVPEERICSSPCPRSPTKTLRAFKRTGSALTPRGRSNHSAPHTPGNRPLRPLSDGITCPKTNQQLPILIPLDSSIPIATPVQYAVDLHRQTPVKQRQKYVLGDTMTKPVPCAEIEGFISEAKQPIGPRRESLQHVPRPHVPRHQPRRPSCPTDVAKDDDHDDREAEEAFERVMDLVDSHTRVADFDSTVVNTPTRKKKPTVEDMKRKLQKDRERNNEKKRDQTIGSNRACGAKGLQSPRRSKGRTARRIEQPISTVSFDPKKEQV